MREKNLWVFLGAVFLGFLMSIFLAGYDKQIFIFSLVVIMLCYTVFCWRRLRGLIGIEDYVYYMGFTFTLVSLARSLTAYADATGMERVISDFGVAVYTTIAGVLCRLVLLQQRGDTETIAQESVVAVARTARELDDELSAAVKTFKRLRQQTEKGTADAIAEVSAVAKFVPNELQAMIERLCELSEKNATDTMQKIVFAAENTPKELQAAFQQLREHAEKEAELASSRRIADADSQSREFQNLIGRLWQQAEEKTVDAVAKVLTAADSIPDELQATFRHLRQQAEADAAEARARRASDAEAQFAELRESAARLWQQAEQQVAQARAALRTDADSLSSELQEVLNEITSATKKIRTRGNNVAETMDHLVSAAGNAASGLDHFREPGKLIEIQFTPVSASFQDTVDSLRQVIVSHSHEMSGVAEAIRTWHAAEERRLARRPWWLFWRQQS